MAITIKCLLSKRFPFRGLKEGFFTFSSHNIIYLFFLEMTCKISKYSSKMSYTHRRGCPRRILGCLNNMDIKKIIKQMDSSRCHYRSNDKNQTFLYLVGAPERTRRRPANFHTIFPRLFSLEYIF